MHFKGYSLSGALVEVLGDLPAPPPLLHIRPTHHGHQQQADHQALHLTNLEFTKIILSFDIYVTNIVYCIFALRGYSKASILGP